MQMSCSSLLISAVETLFVVTPNKEEMVCFLMADPTLLIIPLNLSFLNYLQC